MELTAGNYTRRNFKNHQLVVANCYIGGVNMAIVKFNDVTRVYTSGDHELRALDGVNFTLDEGKFVVILGPSGAGKSTLLNIARRS